MKKIILFPILIIVFISLSCPLFGSDIKVVAVVEKTTPSIGESFIYQIQIHGSDNASGFPKDKWASPDFLNKFKVEFLGGQNNSSRQISIINGRRKEVIDTSYLISYSLTPLVEGVLTIPSVSLSIDGNMYSTKSIKIESKAAEESEDLKLLVTLDKDKAYIGEPLLITFTWYIGMNVKDFFFSVPFFKDRNFNFLDFAEVNPDPSSLVQFPIDGAVVTAVQGKGILKGRSYTTVTFSKLVIPKTPGNFTIPKSAIAVSAEISKRGRSNDLFNSFFSSFSPEYGHFTVPSNDLSIKVLSLPSKGRPENFSGYIGELNIETSASPLNVRVGDPITFTMRISGPKNISEWDPPNLQKQYELAANFKMPSEISAGKIEGNTVVFTQTIRSLNDKVTQIPALEIPFFDVDKGLYSVARSEAIPIIVVKGSAVKIEGTTSPNSSDMQQEVVEAYNNGINHNYNSIKILENQSFGFKRLSHFPLNLLIIVPPLFFLIILILTLIKNERFFTLKSSGKNIFPKTIKDLKKIKSNLDTYPADPVKSVQTLFQGYLANKMSGSNAEKDVKIWLIKNNLTIDEFLLVFEVFSLLDEFQYAGSSLHGKDQKRQIENLIDKVLLALKDLEGRILR